MVRLPPVDGAQAAEVVDVTVTQHADTSTPPAKPDGNGPQAPGPLQKRLGQHVRPVKVVVHKMEEDAVRHLEYMAHRQHMDKAMLGNISQMKHDMRGDFLSNVPLLSVCPGLHNQLGGCLRPWHYAAGERIIQEGDIGDTMYIIERGACDVIKEINKTLVTVGHLGKGAFFGEIGMLYDVPRTATIRTTSAVTVLALSRKDLFAVMSDEEHAAMVLVARTQIFANVPMLKKLSAVHKVRIAEAMKVQEWSQGSMLAGEMNISLKVVIVEEGKVLMQVRDINKLPLYMQNTTDFAGIALGPGQYFGMRGLLFSAPVGFTVTALTEKVRTMSLTLDDIYAAGKDDTEKEDIASNILKAMRAYLLREVPQLKRLTDLHFEEMVQKVTVEQVKKWDVVFSKGQEMNSMYLLEEGKLVKYDGDMEKLSDSTDSNIPCKECSTPGEYFGTDLVAQPKAVASYTLVALTDATLLRIPPEAVRQVMEEERAHLAKVPIFSEHVLDKEDQLRLVDQLKPWNFRSGHCIVKEGDLGDKLFIIHQGVCDIFKNIEGKEVVVGHLRKGGYVGEGAVLYDAPRLATVRAATEVTAVSISREDLLDIVSEAKMDRIRLMGRTQIFHSIPILSELSTGMKVRIAEKLKSEAWKPGTVICKESDESQRLYIVEEGKVTMEVMESEYRLPGADDDHGALKSTRYGGSYFGAVGLLHGMPLGVTVVAGDVTVTTLSISLEEVKACTEAGEADAVLRTMRSGLHCFLLSQVPEFACLDGQLKTVLGYVEELHFEKGQVVLPRGHVPEGLHLLEYGKLAEVNLSGDDIEAGAKWEANILAVKAVSGYYYGMGRSFSGAALPFSIVAADDCCILHCADDLL